MPHSASSSRLSTLRLLAPLVWAQLCAWVATLGTCYSKAKGVVRLVSKRQTKIYTFVLSVECSVSTSTADGMRFCVSFTEEIDEISLSNEPSKQHTQRRWYLITRENMSKSSLRLQWMDDGPLDWGKQKPAEKNRQQAVPISSPSKDNLSNPSP